MYCKLKANSAGDPTSFSDLRTAELLVTPKLKHEFKLYNSVTGVQKIINYHQSQAPGSATILSSLVLPDHDIFAVAHFHSVAKTC